MTGQFKNLDNIIYNITISNGSDVVIGDNDNSQIFFSEEPLVIEEECEDMFTPIITKSATLTLVTKDYIGDMLYATNYKSIPVKVLRTQIIDDEEITECVFDGYVNPGTYNQPFWNTYDTFDVNCSDKLSTLQYYNYKNITAHNWDEYKTSTRSVTFKEIIFDALEDFDNIWYDQSKGLDSLSLNAIFDDLEVTESVILGDDVDSTMTKEEALTAALNYLNLHVTQDGTDAYIFDWESKKKNSINWYNLKTNEVLTKQNTILEIDKSVHASNDTQISISDVYSQINLNCDTDQVDIVISNPLDDETLSSYYVNRQLYEREYISEGEGKTAINAFKDMIMGNTPSNNYEECSIIEWWLQAMHSPYWKFNQHPLPKYEGDIAIDQWEVPLHIKNNTATASILKVGKNEIKSYGKIQDNAPTNKIDMTPYIFISTNGNEEDDDSHYPTDDILKNNQPTIEYLGNPETTGGAFSPVDGDTTNYLVFSGKITLRPIQKVTDIYYKLLNAAKEPNRKKTGYEYDEAGNESTYTYYVEAFTDDYWHKTVPSDNNGDGRYYAQKFFKVKYPRYTYDENDFLNFQSLNVNPDCQDAERLYEFNYSKVGDGSDKYSKLPILECELIIGNKRLVETDMDEFGNSTYKWVDLTGLTEYYVDDSGIVRTHQKTTFSLGVNPKIGDFIIGNEYDIQNTIDYTLNVDAFGTGIPIKQSDNLSGTMIFRILGVCQSVWNNITKHNHREWLFWKCKKYEQEDKVVLAHTESVVIKDFQCKLYSDNAGKQSPKQSQDLVYFSDENIENYHKYDSTTFKFITQPDGETCAQFGLSSAINRNAVINKKTSAPLDKIYNANTNETDVAEKQYVDFYYREYSVPKIILDVDVNDALINVDKTNIYYYKALNKYFIVQAIQRNIFLNKTHLTLKEL